MKIIIIGASSGIGAELARQYANDPHNQVIILARRVERLKAIADKYTNITYYSLDVMDKTQVDTIMARCVNELIRLDLLVYCVGQAMHVKFGDITNIAEVHNKIMAVNFSGFVWSLYACFPALKANGGQAVVVSSVAGELSPPLLNSLFCSQTRITWFL